MTDAPFQLLSSRYLSGHIMGLRSRVIVYDFAVSDRAGASDKMAGFYRAIRPLLPQNPVVDTLVPKAGKGDGLDTVMMLLTLASGLEEAANGMVEERPVVIPVKRPLPTDFKMAGKWRIVSIAVPTVSHHLSTNAVRWLTNLYLRQDDAVDRFETEINDAAKSLHQFAPKGTNMRHIMRAAIRLGVSQLQLPGGVLQLGYGKGARLFLSSISDETSALGVGWAKDKRLTQAIMKMAGLPVVEQRQVDSAEEAVKHAKELGYPVVLKPAALEQGAGVHLRLMNREDVISAYNATRTLTDTIVVEPMFMGKNYRINVIKETVLRAVERTPARVTGDGVNSIRTLVDALNQDPRRSSHSFSLMKTVVLGAEHLAFLRQVSAFTSFDDVPSKGEVVDLHESIADTMGSHVVDVLDTIHPDNKDLCIAAARLFLLDNAGVDLMIPDISKSWKITGANINEVNAQPQMGETHLDIYSDTLKAYVSEGTAPVGLKIVPHSAHFVQTGAAPLLDRERHSVEIAQSPLNIVTEGVWADQIEAVNISDGTFDADTLRLALLLISDHLTGPVFMTENHPSRGDVEALIQRINQDRKVSSAINLNIHTNNTTMLEAYKHAVSKTKP